MKIVAFIPSRNRACQLHALLESLDRNAPGVFSPHVIVRADSKEYLEAYAKLADTFGDKVSIVVEAKPLREHFRDTCRYAESKGDLVALFTDDCVVFRKTGPNAEYLFQFMNRNPEVLHFSYRLGENTIVQDYKTGRKQPPLMEYEGWLPFPGNTDLDPVIIHWPYREYFVFNNYGYVFGMDGCVYRASEMLKWTERNNFSTFRELEGGMTLPAKRDAYPHTRLACSCLSSVVSLPWNSVQDTLLEPSARCPVGVNEFNTRYLSGEIIDLHSMDFSNIVGAHQEVAVRFKRVNQ